jgi:hypothetical protein
MHCNRPIAVDVLLSAAAGFIVLLLRTVYSYVILGRYETAAGCINYLAIVPGIIWLFCADIVCW